MLFRKAFLYQVIFDDCLGDEEVVIPPTTKLIYDKIDSKSRWSVCHDVVFTHEGKFYSTEYSEGATEMQNEAPFEYSPDEIECEEVVPVQKTITVYERKR